MAEDPWAPADDDLVINMAKLGHEDAIAEATRRGLKIPEPPDTSADDGPPEFYAYGDSETTEDTPREKLPVGLLLDLISDGDPEAARVLHERYPDLYDEAGNEIEYADEPA